MLKMTKLSWLGLALAVSASGFGQQNSDLRFDVNLKDATLVSAIRFLSARTGIEFVLEPTSEPFAPVTLHLYNASPDDALRSICMGAGAYYRRNENGVYVISKTKPKADTEEAPKAKVLRNLVKIKLVNADPQQVFKAITASIPYDSKDVALDTMRWNRLMQGNGQLLNDIDRAKQSSLLQASQAPTKAIDPQAPSSISSNDFTIPGESANQGGFGGGLGGGGLGGGQQGGGFGGGFGGGLGGGGLGGQQGGGGFGGQQGGIGGQGRSLIPPGIDYLVYDPNDNSILVRGSDDDIAELKRYIALFDVAPKQVVIKVEYIATSSSLEKSLGFELAYERSSIFFGPTPGSYVRTTDPVFLSYATGNVSGRMRALLLAGSGKSVQSPIIRTLNNQPATIQSVTQTFIFVTTTILNNNAQPVQVSNPVPYSAGTILQVTPRINGDDTVTLLLNSAVTQFGQARSAGAGTQTIPDTIGTSISVVARVKTGQTIALGGMVTKSTLAQQQKYPILGDLPIIGQFFRSENSDTKNTETYVFLTPTIIEDDEVGSIG